MWQWLKFPKGVALLAFLMPWWTVSCSNQKLAEATGFGLATGKISTFADAARNADHGSNNIWLILAIAAIVVGLCLALMGTARFAPHVLGTSLTALALILIGTHRYGREALLSAAEKNGTPTDVGNAVLAVFRVDWQWGYWLAIAALATSALLAWQTMQNRE